MDPLDHNMHGYATVFIHNLNVTREPVYSMFLILLTSFLKIFHHKYNTFNPFNNQPYNNVLIKIRLAKLKKDVL